MTHWVQSLNAIPRGDFLMITARAAEKSDIADPLCGHLRCGMIDPSLFAHCIETWLFTATKLFASM